MSQERHVPKHASVHVVVPAPVLPRRVVRIAGTAALALSLALVAGTGSSAFAHPAAKPAVQQQAVAAPVVQLPAPSFSAVTMAPAAPVAAPANTRAKPAPVTQHQIVLLAANGIPRIALNAYRVAAARMDNADPACGIGWWLLAGIGRVESDHGQFAGATLNADGTSTPRIIGPALNGKNGYPLIPSTDNGLFDGDKVYAHAVGPMQFLPSTWYEYASDGNNDGTADPFDINDAALAAARYLCAAGGNLASPANQAVAVYTYNHSDIYVAEVLALANDYKNGIKVSGIPVIGPTTGDLPPVGPAPTQPANPATPPALGSGGKVTASQPKQGSSTSSAPSPTPSPSGSPTKSPTPTPSPTSSAPNPVTSLICQLTPALCPK